LIIFEQILVFYVSLINRDEFLLQPNWLVQTNFIVASASLKITIQIN